MQKVVFSEHARYQMKERNIPKELIVETIDLPDKIILQSNERTKAVKLFKFNKKKYLLVVIFEESRLIKKIITVFSTSKIKKYL